MVIKKFSLGATTNFFGQFIAISLFNEIETDEPKSFVMSTFISAIVAGGFLETINDKIDSLLAQTALAVGLNHCVLDVVDRMLGGEGLNHETFIEDYIFDTIIVYYIVLVVNQIYKLLYIKTDREEFGGKVLGFLPLSIAINMYYNYRYPEEVVRQ